MTDHPQCSADSDDAPLPCPFCGGTDLTVRSDRSEDQPNRVYAFHVFCGDCHAHGRNHYRIGWCETALAARQAWNDRTTDDAQPAVERPSVEAMKAAVELEILSALGRVHTVKIGEMIQKIMGASRPQCSAGNVDALIEALMPFSEAADWYDATQNYLDDDAVVHKEKHGLGELRINVRHLREARRALRTFDEPQAARQWPRVFNVQRSKFNHWHADISFARCPTDDELKALEILLRDDHQPDVVAALEAFATGSGDDVSSSKVSEQ